MDFSHCLRRAMLAVFTSVTAAAMVPAHAHFQMLIPSDDMVGSPSERFLRFDIKFWDPFLGYGASIDTPVQFGVRAHGRNIDLRTTLKPHAFLDFTGKSRDGFQADYEVTSPGDYIFYVEPKPYWEEGAGVYVVQYTKVVVNGLGLEQGWDDAVGLKAEIIPLTRPYGLYTNNVFQGIVKIQGRPAPYTKVEVSYYNQYGKLKLPDQPLITQVVKTDANGVFTYAMPRAGWWGFAALHREAKKMLHDGTEYPVEIGALIWVETHDMPQ